MNHGQAVEILKTLPKHMRWSGAEAMSVIQGLDRRHFTRPTDYAEAVTVAIIGQRWEAVPGRQGYDTAGTLMRWLGRKALEYDNPQTHFDAKTKRKGIGYSEKVPEWASKATDLLDRRRSDSVINGVIFHTPHGAFFQLGMDHESTTPRFGKRKRRIAGIKALPHYIDGEGGILPAVLLSSRITWNGDGFEGLDTLAVEEVNRRLARILKTILREVEMEKLQKHLGSQAKKAIAQATDKMLNNRIARGIMAERVAANPKALAQATRKMLKNKAARKVVAEKLAANPEALEAAMQNALASGKLACSEPT
jgi:hypothetical protein